MRKEQPYRITERNESTLAIVQVRPASDASCGTSVHCSRRALVGHCVCTHGASRTHDNRLV